MISIVIVNYRTPDDLLRLLESLARHPPAGDCEVIVVDNASGDDSVARARAVHPEHVYVESLRNTGFSGGVNTGLARARGDWLLILNPDIEVRAGSIDRLRDWLEAHPRAGLAAARLLNPDGSLQPTCRTFYTFRTVLLRRSFLGKLMPNDPAIRAHLMLDYDHATPRVVDWVAGACMMVRRRALEEVGPMDERYFMYFEDVDWCARMHRRGWQVWYVPDAVMQHGYRRASAGGFGRAARTHAGSFIRFWEKYSALLYLIRRHRHTLRTLCLMLADLVAINLAFLAAYFLRQEMASVLAKPLFPLAYYVTFLVVTNVVSLGAFAYSGLYRDERRGDWIDTLFSAGRALLLSCLLLLAITFILAKRDYSRVILLSFWPVALLLVTLERRLIYEGLEKARRERLNVKRLALLGADPRFDEIARTLREDPRHGFEPIRHDSAPAGGVVELTRWLQDERISDVVLADGTADSIVLVGALRGAGIYVHILSPLSGLPAERLRLSRIGGASLITLEGAEGTPGRQGLRRLFERAVALTLLIVYLLPAVAVGFILLVTGRRPRWERRAAPDSSTSSRTWRVWTAAGWGARLLRRLALDRYPTLLALFDGRLPLAEALPQGDRPGPALLTASGGRPLAGQAGAEDEGRLVEYGRGGAGGWSAERDLKFLLRDTLARLLNG